MLQFDVTHALPFLPKNWMSSRLDGLTEACNLLERGNGLGGQFTGWVKLPETYDRQEVQRLLQTAQIIRKQSDVLIVIGIGGSYLGARALLELLASPHYNLLARKTPQIFFTGNTLSSDAMTELLELRPATGTSRSTSSPSPAPPPSPPSPSASSGSCWRRNTAKTGPETASTPPPTRHEGALQGLGRARRVTPGVRRARQHRRALQRAHRRGPAAPSPWRALTSRTS